MNEFKREDRYVVVKLKKLTHMQERHLFSCIKGMDIQTVDSVVVESDWPEYEPTWAAIERRMTGQPPVTAAEELEAVRHWRGKHDQAIKERDQLQQDLTERDERLDKAGDDFTLLSLEAGQRMELLEKLLRGWLDLFPRQGITGGPISRQKEKTQAALKPAFCDCNQGRLPCTCKGAACPGCTDGCRVDRESPLAELNQSPCGCGACPAGCVKGATP